jgi:hypothetical protein
VQPNEKRFAFDAEVRPHPYSNPSRHNESLRRLVLYQAALLAIAACALLALLWNRVATDQCNVPQTKLTGVLAEAARSAK